MFYTLILENQSGEQVNLSATANQYMTSKIEGLNPPAGTISTSSYAGMNGSYLNNAFIEKRNVVISLCHAWHRHRETTASPVSCGQAVPIHQDLVQDGEHRCLCRGYVGTCEVSNFEQQISGQ